MKKLAGFKQKKLDEVMIAKNIVSENYQDLNITAENLKKNYLLEEPFPNIVIDNFFNKDFLNSILNDFPNLGSLDSSSRYENKNEIKYTNNQYNAFSKNTKIFFDFLNSQIFLQFIQKITSIKETLVADKELNGGGLHEIKKGGVLKIHTDFNRHPTLNLDRRVNVLIYLNKNWKEEYDGHLELWDKEMKECKKKILPIFNRMVIFSTNDFSNHGHPNAIKCPIYQSRKSIALYYFSKGRPLEELNINYIKNKTYFKDRLGHHNDTDSKNEYFKNFIRNLSFYKLLKNLEKKYFRKKNR